MLSHLFLGMSLLGAEWVLYLLVLISVLSISLIFDRVIFYRSAQSGLVDFRGQLRKAVAQGKWDDAERAAEARLKKMEKGRADLETEMAYELLRYSRAQGSRRAEPATLTKSSDPKGALEWAKASLDSVPGNREALALSYALVFHKDERRAGEFRSELFRLHEPVSAELSLAESFRLTGNLPEADAAIERALARVPESGLLNFEKALIAADRGLGLDAVRSFNKALTLFPVHNFRVTALDPVFSGLVAKEPGDPEIAAARIRELARSGRIDEADELALRWVNKGRAPTDIQEMAAALGRLKSGVASDAPADQNHSR